MDVIVLRPVDIVILLVVSLTMYVAVISHAAHREERRMDDIIAWCVSMVLSFMILFILVPKYIEVLVK